MVPTGEEAQARPHLREVAQCEAATEGSLRLLPRLVPPHWGTWPGFARRDDSFETQGLPGLSSVFLLSFTTCLSSFFVLGEGEGREGGNNMMGQGEGGEALLGRQRKTVRQGIVEIGSEGSSAT